MFSEGERLLLERIGNAVPGLSAEALGIVWNAIKIEVTRRLAVERKPVDLGFVKLIPLPYRQDWKEQIISKGSAFYDAIDDPALMAINISSGFIHWSVECIPSSGLLGSIDKHECARKERLGIADYSDAILSKDVPNTLGHAIRIINQHCARSSKPSPLRRRLKDDTRVLLYEPVRRVNTNQAPVNGRGPSTLFPADKKTRSQESSIRSPHCEKLPDPLPEEQPAGTGAARG